MRIIGGSAKGRRLYRPGGSRGSKIRPTSDRAREAVFNLLAPEISGSFVLDLFAGTGAMGLEALSRGAQGAVLIDSNPEALKLIKKNIEICSFEKLAICRKADLTRSLSFLEKYQLGSGFDIIFMDPPYNMLVTGHILEEISRADILAPNAVVISEIRSKEELPERVGRLSLYQQRSYGEAGFWFFAVEQP